MIACNQLLFLIGLLFATQCCSWPTGIVFDPESIQLKLFDNFEEVLSRLTEPVSARPIPKFSPDTGAMGPLLVHPDNPRFFANATGKAVFFTGSHTWCNFQNCTAPGQSAGFAYDAYLNFLASRNHNFIRLWHSETQMINGSTGLSGMRFSPMPYLAVTGEDSSSPKFDLSKFNPDYFERLRSHVKKARDKGIYVSIMLFNGWTIESKRFDYSPWGSHPYNAKNNVNGIDGDLNRNGQGEETHILDSAIESGVLDLQKAYVRQVIDTVNDLDNVLYEISNESSSLSYDWQFHLIDYVKQYEAKLPFQHPVGMTVAYPDGDNNALLNSHADWISPSKYIESKGEKVIIFDTDHLCGICGKRQSVWESLTGGASWIFMDPYDSPLLPEPGIDGSTMTDVRKNMGYAHYFANRMNLGSMLPRPDLCSSRHCIAGKSGSKAEILAYIPEGGSVDIDLSDFSGKFLVEWFNPASGHISNGEMIDGGDRDKHFSAPFIARDSVIYIHRDKNLDRPLDRE